MDFPHPTGKDGITGGRGVQGVKADLHFKDAHLNHQRLRLGLTGNSTKGARPFSSDGKHLFKVAHAIMITVCNQQRSTGPGGWSTRNRLSASHGLHLVPRGPRNRRENAPSRDRFPAAAGPGTNAPWAEPRCSPAGGTGRRRWPVAQRCARGRVKGPQYGRAYISHARLPAPAWATAAESAERGAPRTPPARTRRAEGGGGEASAGWRRSTLAALLAPAGFRRRAPAAAAAAPRRPRR